MGQICTAQVRACQIGGGVLLMAGVLGAIWLAAVAPVVLLPACIAAAATSLGCIILAEAVRRERMAWRLRGVAGPAHDDVRHLLMVLRSMTEQLDPLSDERRPATGVAETMLNGRQPVARAVEALATRNTTISHQIVGALQTAQTAADEARRAGESIAHLQGRLNRAGELCRALERGAAQASLLALNATIEAARMGPDGRKIAAMVSELRILTREAGAFSVDAASQIENARADCEILDQVNRGFASAVQRLGGVVAELGPGAAGQEQTIGVMTERMDISGASRDLGTCSSVAAH